jgi:glutamyl-tRNA(Gln) amidotransferase subunit D
LVPAHELSGERIIQLKLPSGYNVGVRVHPRDTLTVFPPSAPTAGGSGTRATSSPPLEPGKWVAILTTGGTIASRIDYRTGGVRPVKDEAEILSFYPQLGRDGPVHVVPVFDRLSENIGPEDWVVLAERTAEMFRQGARGVVVAHGTDTISYTAAALSFALTSLPGPVVLVGAQRSPDRPSSDGTPNFQAATHVAWGSDLGEVVVVMHAGLSDTSFSIHRGTRVRKLHSSRRDAFRSRNGPPLGRLDDQTLKLRPGYRARVDAPVQVDSRLDPRGGMLWSYPGLPPEPARAFVAGLRGVILAGTGLGHVNSVHLPWIREAVARGTFVGMTTQCLEGSVDPYVYATGRELLRAGVTYLGDLMPQTAYVKLLFALGRYSSVGDVRRYLLTDQVGEFEDRHSVEVDA